jgi:hypothetical protein
MHAPQLLNPSPAVCAAELPLCGSRSGANWPLGDCVPPAVPSLNTDHKS